MNLVALLVAPAVVSMTLEGNDVLRWSIAGVAVAIVVVAVVISKSRPIAVSDADEDNNNDNDVVDVSKS